MLEGAIRVITLGLVKNAQGSYLFDTMTDPKKGLSFLRPIGGGVDFGEDSRSAIAREFKEEIKATVLDSKLLTVFENIFEYDGKQGHEVVFLYELTIQEEELLRSEVINICEGSEKRTAKWYDLDSLQEATILPNQIKSYL